MAASNNEIYRLLTDFSGKIGELAGTVRGIDAKVDEMREDMSEAEAASAAYRAGVRDELGKLVLRTTQLEAEVSSVVGRVNEMQAVTVDVVTLRTKAEGAGTVGLWMLKLGIGLVGFAGWVLGAYTWWTGRPPP